MEVPSRILFICHDGDLYGSQQSLNLIVRYLPEHLYQCFVSIARPGPLQRVLQDYPNTVVMRHKRLQWVKHDFRSGWQKIGDVLSLLLAAVPRTLYLFYTIRREKINLVHTNSSVSLEGALAAALAGVPHVWHIRELFMKKSPKFHLVLGRRFSRWLIDRFSDQVICISDIVLNQFGPYRDADPDKYLLLYNALELSSRPEYFEINDPQRHIMRSLSLKVLGLPDTKAFRVGYIGRLSAGKGFHELLEAFAMLRRRGIHLELLVAGNFVDEPYRERIEAAMAEECLRHTVRFFGYQEDLRPLYEVLDVLVVPSLNEPFGRVIIEAAAHGVPCIASNSGGIPEIIESGETGLLYPPGDVYALAGLMEELMTAFWKLETLRQNALRMVYERFNIEMQIRTLSECYQLILARHQLM
jgi:glycosyltransferase involved in cell wall biosynthesis